MTPHSALSFARRNRARYVRELAEFVRFPTVSSQPAHSRDVRRCAAWLARHLRRIGLERVQIVPTRSHPVVYAEWKRAAGRPTLLIYGHYDVQPAEPLSQWHRPPFRPTVQQNRLYGRGASDDKGQLFTHIKAIEAYLKTGRRLPINVQCIFEGDEERGSPELESFVAHNRSALRADCAVISDTRMLGPGKPTIGYAQRGNLRLELELQGQARELHSGNFGGAVRNPLQVLCGILAGLHDEDGRVAIPGFYDDVREWDAREREYMARVGPADEDIRKSAGVAHSWGEPGFSEYERISIRPALTLNGLSGGYYGPGIKTVIPSRAIAKLSVRIVPDQKSRTIEALFRKHIESVTPAGVRAQVRTLGRSEPALVSRNHPALRAAVFASERIFGKRPVFLRSGGSVAAANIIQRILRVPAVLMGFALPQDNVHSTNESFDLTNFSRGIEVSIWFLAALARMHAGRRFSEQAERVSR